MAVSREGAIRLASRFAEANGYRVVRSFDGLPWSDEPRQVRLDAARWIDGEWSVLFEKQLHPAVEAECPGDICVVVGGESGECQFYPML
jgi:hypothetical protein